MLHRLPEQHECLFDHLGRGRQEAVLKMVKLDRKVGRSCQRIGEECSWASSHSEEPPCSDCVLALAGFIFSLIFFSPQFFFRTPPHTLLPMSWLFSTFVDLIASLLLEGLVEKSIPRNDGTMDSKRKYKFFYLFASFWLDMCGAKKNK